MGRDATAIVEHIVRIETEALTRATVPRSTEAARGWLFAHRRSGESGSAQWVKTGLCAGKIERS